MRKNVLLILIGGFFLTFGLQAQQVNTHYFIGNSPVRHILNPAVQPDYDMYIGIPGLSYLQAGVANNSLTVSDFVYRKNGKTITAIHPEGDKDKFYKGLRNNTVLATNAQITAIGFGMKFRKKEYLTFTLSEKAEGYLSLPKDVFRLLLYGTPDIRNNRFDLRKLNTDFMIYTEAAFGYSRNMDRQLTLGGKVKFLVGTAHGSLGNKELDLEAGIDRWRIEGNSKLKLSSPYIVEFDDRLDSVKTTALSGFSDWLKPAGFGAGIDIGAVYRINKQLIVSAAITDIGMILWNRNSKTLEYRIDYSFEGFELDDLGNIDFDSFIDTIADAARDAAVSKQSDKTYISSTLPKILLSAEYGILDNKLLFGVLSRTVLRKFPYQEILLSVNGRPLHWLDASLSYSLLNGNFNTIGFGVGIRAGYFHFFYAMDYLAFNYAKYDNIPVPYKSKGMNFALGMNIVFGGQKKKSEYDCYGVGNEKLKIEF